MSENKIDSSENNISRVELDKNSFDKFKLESKVKDYGSIYQEADPQDLADGVVKLLNIVVDHKADTLFFLDKSARPCAYLFLSVWEDLYPGVKHPDIKFINIGHESNVDSLSDRVIKDVRDRYKNTVGKNVVVVDEWSDTGKTLTKAEKAMKVFFPGSNVQVVTMFNHLPFWYGIKKSLGVADYEKFSYMPPHFVVKPFFGFGGKKDDFAIHKSRKLRSDLVEFGKALSHSIRKISEQ